MPSVEFVVVSADLEISKPPRVPKLYFWALQAGFVKGSRPKGAGHLGLQHHPSYPGNGAANWGGYNAPADGGGELNGSGSPLISALGNANTFNYSWVSNTKYRLRIAQAGTGHWRGSIINLSTLVETVVRDLYVDADRLTTPIVWSEVFADCDQPLVGVRWSNLAAITAGGKQVQPSALIVSYQTVADGGCSNTDVVAGAAAFEQRTNSERQTPHGTRLPL